MTLTSPALTGHAIDLKTALEYGDDRLDATTSELQSLIDSLPSIGESLAFHLARHPNVPVGWALDVFLDPAAARLINAMASVTAQRLATEGVAENPGLPDHVRVRLYEHALQTDDRLVVAILAGVDSTPRVVLDRITDQFCGADSVSVADGDDPGVIAFDRLLRNRSLPRENGVRLIRWAMPKVVSDSREGSVIAQTITSSVLGRPERQDWLTDQDRSVLMVLRACG